MSKVCLSYRVAVCAAALLMFSVPPLAAQEPRLAPPSIADTTDAGRPPSAAPGLEAARPVALLPLYVSFAALQALDVHSTLMALEGGAREGNPVMRKVVSSPASLVAVKALSTAGALYAAEKLWKRNRTLAILTMIGLNGAYLAVVSHNYSAAR